jgi:hypothetical protein
MRIFDAFPFCDEVDLATLRINYLSKSVDRFIVGEFNTSFSGARKEYNFPRVIERLPSSLRKRIDYYALKQPEPSLNPFENDDFQKNTFTSMFQEGLNHEDYVLLGDCDEFPSIDGIRRALKELVGGAIGYVTSPKTTF